MSKHFSVFQYLSVLGGLLVLTLIFLSGCSYTRVTAVWFDQEYQGNGINNVFVVGVSESRGLRRIVEDEFVAQFKQWGIKATASYRVLPDEDLQDEKKLDKLVFSSGSDTILMTRLVDIKKETHYIPPDYVYVPSHNYYRNWHGYYRAYMVSPGYTVEYETAVLETNLYDLKADRLIWSARSVTPMDDNFSRYASDFVRSIMYRLAKAGLI